MQVMTGAVACVIRFGNELTLADVYAFSLESRRDAALGDVHINLVSPRRCAAVFKGDAIGAAGITVGAGIPPMINIAALGREDFEHGAIGKIKGVGAVVTR